ncbi:hypothetical protein A2Z33_05870 [Candidatus Gottesmanbacteria bacterium RBG_16_52_11]|uniref:PD-(D/E)XK endonuclease-like domain-containing protein n=1 Tax=Candidatus Gottesmanbacteria bacterium RBG_16_52_11 TaxID=1798374 RepID=A0A1F5YX82_9BACT|nr:MAG: hypothetical protein A2Z33_05870 [Candidatus Gottesmanbacteria bacterium RBG_16_52_11]
MALYDPADERPYRVSRTKIDLFVSCPRCFWLDRRAGISRPPGFPFTLNNAVDTLLKKEFDIHRAKGIAHPLMKEYGLKAVPLSHKKIDEWRDSRRRGITYHHPKTNLVITGGIDDVWVRPDGELIIVDYKATSTKDEITLDSEYKEGYKRQMEIYQWLFRKNGFRVSSTGYFVYANGRSDRKAFDGKLEFDVQLIPYTGSDRWVEKTVVDLWKCLRTDHPPEAADECEYCAYAASRIEADKTPKKRVYVGSS